MSLTLGIIASSRGNIVPPLDTYGGAAAAYSTRLLSSAYGGSAVRVRRSFDNAEQDIGFSGGAIDETALMNFVGYQNLVQRSEEFGDAYWNKLASSVSTNVTTDPFGTNNADSITETTANSAHEINTPNSFSFIVGQSYTFSAYAKQSVGTRNIILYLGTSVSFGSSRIAIFSLSTGQCVYNDAGVQFNSIPLANGWWRFSITSVAISSTATIGAFIAMANGSTFPSSITYVGDGVSTFFIYGAQLNIGTTAQPYQVTTSAARSGDGFVTKWYTQDSNGENLFTYSEQFDNIDWKAFGGATKTGTNIATAPNGTLTADSIRLTTANTGSNIYQEFLSASANVYNVSVWVKRNAVTDQTFQLFINIRGTLLSSGNLIATDTWQRFNFSGTYSAGSTASVFGIIGNTAGTTSDLLVWGAQLSQGSWLQPYQVTTITAILRRDASQSTAANQPRIVGGGVIERENGKASIFFDGVNDFLSISSVQFAFANVGYINSFYTVKNNLNTYTDQRIVYALSANGGASTRSNSGTQLNRVFGVGGRRLDTDAYVNVTGGPVTTSLSTVSPIVQYANSDVYLYVNNMLSALNTSFQTDGNTSSSNAGSSTIGSQYDGASGFWSGDISELFLYNTNILTNVSDINRNIGAYYQTHWTGASSGLLDQFGGAAAAYSLRNLSSSYRGPLIRVRRSSDNAETDIGGTYNGDLDVASLLSFTGGQNLFLQSEDFSSVSWTKNAATVTANATIAPDGILTADKIAETAVNTEHTTLQAFFISTLSTYTLSFYAKAAERSKFRLVFYLSSSPFDYYESYFDLSNGTVYKNITLAAGSFISSSIQSVGNGWFRCSVTGNTNKTGNHNAQFTILNDSWQTSYLGVAGSGVYVWGAQLNTGILQPYIPTTTAAVNGANAFVTKWYTQDNNYQNLVLQSQTFENASWLKLDISASSNTTTAPDGSLTADSIIPSTVNTVHYIIQSVSKAASSLVYTVSAYVKPFGYNFVTLGAVGSNPINQATVAVDLTNLSKLNATNGTGFSVIDSSVTSEGNGWFRVSLTFSSDSSLAVQHVIRVDNTFNNGTYAGNGTSGLYVWGAQLNEGTLVPYTATTTTVSQRRDAIQATAANQPRIVNAGGVESEGNRPALFFDGVDDTINFDTVAPLFAGEDIPLSAFSTVKSSVNGWFFAIADSSISNPIHGYSVVAGSGVDNFRRSTSSTQIVVANTDSSTIYKLNSHMFAGTTLSVSNNAVDNIVGASQDTPSLTQLNTATIGALRYQPFPNGTTFFTGDVGEFVLYRANQFSLRQSIQSNINSYYRIYWQGNGTALLDSFSGASAAYSLRNLSSAYTGPLIRVRRSSDNVERDIYGTFGGDLDIASLVAFVGANSGFVTTWYDQSGSARHASIGTATNQPRIVNAGVVDTQNGKPAVWFDGVDDTLFSNVSLLTTNNKIIFSLFMLRSQSPTFSVIIQAFKDTYGPVYTLGLGVNIIEVNALQSGASVVTNVPLLATVNYYAGVQSSALRKNGVNAGTSMRTNGYDNPTNQIWIGSGQGASPAAMTASEFIIYTTNQTASIPTIESNINNYYKIY